MASLAAFPAKLNTTKMKSKYHFMALHFSAKLCQDSCSANVWKQQVAYAFQGKIFKMYPQTIFILIHIGKYVYCIWYSQKMQKFVTFQAQSG